MEAPTCRSASEMPEGDFNNIVDHTLDDLLERIEVRCLSFAQKPASVAFCQHSLLPAFLSRALRCQQSSIAQYSVHYSVICSTS